MPIVERSFEKIASDEFIARGDKPFPVCYVDEEKEFIFEFIGWNCKGQACYMKKALPNPCPAFQRFFK
jgi:hypothetical protein